MIVLCSLGDPGVAVFGVVLRLLVFFLVLLLSYDCLNIVLRCVPAGVVAASGPICWCYLEIVVGVLVLLLS